MATPVPLRTGLFQHVVMEGSAYEVGKMQGKWFAAAPQEHIDLMLATSDTMTKVSAAEAKASVSFLDTYCPGLSEEIAGFADSWGVPPEVVAYYSLTAIRTSNCSHFAVLPEATADGHLYVGRSYEWSCDDELRLCTTRIHGQAAHLGFSLFLFGRYDGINEHGLCIAMSAGVPCSMPAENGLRFWAVIRTLLDRCKTVDEALETFAAIPVSFNWNFTLADRSGQAALVECASSHREVKKIGPETAEKSLYSTNHFTLPGMQEYDRNRMRQSVQRYNALEFRLKSPAALLDRVNMRNLLSTPMPDGVCCHYYDDGLGTLWSILFDVTTGETAVCFGSPAANPWRVFTLDDPVGVKTYPAHFPCEESTKKMWEKVK